MNHKTANFFNPLGWMLRHSNLTLIWLLLAATGHAQDLTSGASPMRGSASPPGYLVDGEYPDSIRLLPPPPAPGTTAFTLDEELNRQALALRDTARWKLAARDAIPNPGQVFSCALGVTIAKPDTPKLFALLRRSATDVVSAGIPAKKFYQRQRPFLVNEQPICVPGSEEATGKDGSYPSGHAALGWVWALIFTEIAPDRADAVLARGREFGQSRAVCNVHWQSDITYGRTMGTALVARLHANQEFRTDLEYAREEFASARAEKLPLNNDCDAKAQAPAAGRPGGGLAGVKPIS